MTENQKKDYWLPDEKTSEGTVCTVLCEFPRNLDQWAVFRTIKQRDGTYLMDAITAVYKTEQDAKGAVLMMHNRYGTFGYMKCHLRLAEDS